MFPPFASLEISAMKAEALSLRAEREKEPNLDAVVPREDRGWMEGVRRWWFWSSLGKL